MKTGGSFIQKADSPQEAERMRLFFERQYPGVCLSLATPGRGYWIIQARGPWGSYILNSPSPLREESLTALCRMACTCNLGEGNV